VRWFDHSARKCKNGGFRRQVFERLERTIGCSDANAALDPFAEHEGASHTCSWRPEDEVRRQIAVSPAPSTMSSKWRRAQPNAAAKGGASGAGSTPSSAASAAPETLVNSPPDHAEAATPPAATAPTSAMREAAAGGGSTVAPAEAKESAATAEPARSPAPPAKTDMHTKHNDDEPAKEVAAELGKQAEPAAALASDLALEKTQLASAPGDGAGSAGDVGSDAAAADNIGKLDKDALASGGAEPAPAVGNAPNDAPGESKPPPSTGACSMLERMPS
jgi:hypothetical protein